MKTTSLADVITKNNRYEKIAANGISIARTFFQDHDVGVYAISTVGPPPTVTLCTILVISATEMRRKSSKLKNIFP